MGLIPIAPSWLIDGAKALHKAVIETFGARVLIHRCQAHKKRNVTDALPERMRASVHSAMNQAHAARDPKRARRLLENLSRRLESAHPGAAGSLREGLEETPTVMPGSGIELLPPSGSADSILAHLKDGFVLALPVGLRTTDRLRRVLWRRQP